MRRIRRKTKTEVTPTPFQRIESGHYTPPTPEQVRELVEGMEMTQAKGAELCGVDPRTFRRWLSLEQMAGEPSSIPYTAWQLLLYHAGHDLGWQYCKED